MTGANGTYPLAGPAECSAHAVGPTFPLQRAQHHLVPGGAVIVTAERVADQMEIRVIDDGVGLPPGWSLESSAGLGLSVTRERIAGLHPNDNTRFVVKRRSGGGTEVPAPVITGNEVKAVRIRSLCV